MKYGDVTLGQIEAVWNKLGGEKGVKKFLSGETVVKLPDPLEFKTWKTLKLGTGLKSADDFRHALKQGGYRIGDWANNILSQTAFSVSSEAMEIDLVVRSVAELGFKDGATRRETYERAEEFGLGLCTAEVGPQLRLQYVDQPKGEWLLIAMEPIADSDGFLRVFDVACGDDDRWLRSAYGDPESFWNGRHRWVFRLRK